MSCLNRLVFPKQMFNSVCKCLSLWYVWLLQVLMVWISVLYERESYSRSSFGL